MKQSTIDGTKAHAINFMKALKLARQRGHLTKHQYECLKKDFESDNR